MQIFFLPDMITVILFFILWPIFQVSASILCLKLPDSFYSPDKFLFKERKWEKGGTIYHTLFKVRLWKRFLPDGGAVTTGYRKKHFSDHNKSGYEKFIVESCRAELIHLLGIFPFWIFGLFAPLYIIPIMLLYELALNLPCIISQRFNRPRFVKLLKKLPD